MSEERTEMVYACPATNAADDSDVILEIDRGWNGYGWRCVVAGCGAQVTQVDYYGSRKSARRGWKRHMRDAHVTAEASK